MAPQQDSAHVHAGEDGQVRVSILGEVDMSRFEELNAILESVQADSPPGIEIDLASVSFMDSQGLRLLLRAHTRAESGGTTLRIVGASELVRRLFEIAGVTGMLDVAASNGTQTACPCCSAPLRHGEPPGDGLRPGDGWCPRCRWIVLREVLAGVGWPVECPTHGRLARDWPAPSQTP